MIKQDMLTAIRLDKSIKSFNKLWNMLSESKDRIEKSRSRVVAKWRLFPPEIIYALGASPYDLLLHEGLTKTAKGNIRTAGYAIEAGLSADSCVWNLTATGEVLSKSPENTVNIFLAAVGLCDISSKSWQLMAKNTGKPLYSMEIPIFSTRSERRATTFIQEELITLFERLGRCLGAQYSDSKLQNEIKRGNDVRSLLLELTALQSHNPPPVSALEYFLTHVTVSDYLQDPVPLAESLAEIKEDVKKRCKEDKAPPEVVDNPVRVYYVGMAPQDLKFWNLIENAGGALVGCDTYLSLFYELISQNGSPIRNLARWLWMMPHHMPGIDRAKTLTKYIKQQNPDAIIIGNVIGCRNLSSSDRIMKETLKEELGVPVTSIEFGSSDEDISLLEPHVKAFIEMCK